LWAREEGPFERYPMYLAGDCGLTARKMDHMNGRNSFYAIRRVSREGYTIPFGLDESPVVRM
jgi:hypothetical protein